MAKKALLFTLVSIVVLALSGCAGGAYDLAFPARGDSTNLLALTQTEQFRKTEDLNVVVKLNSHDGVTVSAQFIDPDGEQVGETLETEVDSETGTVVLGLDYDQVNADRSVDDPFEWQTGTWTVKVSVDGEEVDEITFRIN